VLLDAGAVRLFCFIRISYKHQHRYDLRTSHRQGLAIGCSVAAYALLKSKASDEADNQAFFPCTPTQIGKNGASQAMYKEAKSVVAGGVGLLSKRPENHLPEVSTQLASLHSKAGASLGGCQAQNALTSITHSERKVLWPAHANSG